MFGKRLVYAFFASAIAVTLFSYSGMITATARTIVQIVQSSEGKIAFDSKRDGNFEIYVMNPDGTGQIRVTNNPADDERPSWSPDGNHIAFRSNRDGNWEIYTMNFNGSGQTRLTDNSMEDGWPAWSPDGTHIVYPTQVSGSWEIYVMNANGSGQTRLTNNAVWDVHPAWSPDGSKIAFASYRDGQWGIFVMNPDGSAQTRLTAITTSDQSPAWSPDGTRIAFFSHRDGDDEIYTMNANGTGQTRLTDSSGWDIDPAWSSDGTHITFMSYRDGNWEIYVMNAAGIGQTRLTNNPAEDGGPDWLPIVSSTIIDEARLDIGMPYDVNRGCGSPYIGCAGPYHGFYNGVCTDLALDAYNFGVPFNIQNALYQDHRAHSGRYRYGTARNAEDMRRYFVNNQVLLPHSQAYQSGDIAFFDWNGDGLTDHVNVISEVDSNNRPLKIVDATGTYSGNPSGLAFEHNWSDYYDLHSQGHGRLNQILAEISDVATETLPILRISLSPSSSIAFSVFDANGKFISADYDENLVASNIEAFIPYIPGGSYIDTGSQQVITVTYPLSNTNRYTVKLEGQVNTTYNLLIETLEDKLVTDSELFTQSLTSGETHSVEITLSDGTGNIEFSATPPTASPLISAPASLALAGLVSTSAQLTFTISETGGQYPINGIVITSTELSDQLGGVISASKLSIAPNSFDVATNGSREVSIQIDLSGILPGIYQGSLIISTQNGGSYRVPFVLNIEFHQIYLPVITRQ
jgi:TolB protein